MSLLSIHIIFYKKTSKKPQATSQSILISNPQTESRNKLQRRHKPSIHLLPLAQDLLRLHQVLAHCQRPHHLWPPHRPAALQRPLLVGSRPYFSVEEEETDLEQLKQTHPPKTSFECNLTALNPHVKVGQHVEQKRLNWVSFLLLHHLFSLYFFLFLSHDLQCWLDRCNT